MATNPEQDARHAQAVRAYYETGDETSLAPLLVGLRPVVLRFLARRLNSRHADKAEDLAQETLAELVKQVRARKVTLTGRLTTYVLGVALRKLLAAVQQRPSNAPNQPSASEDPFLLLPPALAQPPEELPVAAEDEDRAGALIEAATTAVLALDPNARAVVALHYYHGLTPAEATDRLGITAEQFRQRLRRGLAALQHWAQQNPQLAPGPAVYEALRRVNTGELFEEGNHFERRVQAREQKLSNKRKSRQRLALAA